MSDKYSVTTPCPFCGAKLVERNHPGGRGINDFHYSYHQCPTIECLLHWVEIKFEDRERWNTRAESPAEAKLEAIREALERCEKSEFAQAFLVLTRDIKRILEG